jgi:hypothetical protein
MIFVIFRKHKGWFAFTYSLLLLEFFLFSSAPYLLGKTIDSLLAGSRDYFYFYLSVLVVALVTGFVRRRLDTRVFMRIWAEKCVSSIQGLADQGVESALIVSRSPLVSKYIDFFEMILPNTVACLMDITLATIVIWCFVPDVAWIITILALVAMSCSYGFSFIVKKIEVQSQETRESLNNSIIEREWTAIPSGYDSLRKKLVRISDLDAYSWGISDLLQIVALIIVILKVVQDGRTAGVILSNIIYVGQLFNRAGFLTVFFNYLKQLEVCEHFLSNGKNHGEYSI